MRAVNDPTFDGKVSLDRQGYDTLVKRLTAVTPKEKADGITPIDSATASQLIQDNDVRDDKHALRVLQLPDDCQISSDALQKKL